MIFLPLNKSTIETIQFPNQLFLLLQGKSNLNPITSQVEA